MFAVIVPIPTELETAVQPFRQKYDNWVNLVPAHISILLPFEYHGKPDELHDHLQNVCDTHAPIKISLAGWDIHHNSKGYQMRLPIIAGRSELTALKSSLSSGILAPLAKQQETGHWPYIFFGQVATHRELQEAKKQLAGFEPQFIFRSNYLRLLQRSSNSDPWQVQQKIGLKATLSSPRRRSKTPAPLKFNQPIADK